MFEELEKINARPRPFEFYTASDLWTDEHTSEQMLAYHLNGEIDVSSRRTDFINDSVRWMTNCFDLSSNSRIIDFGCGPGLYTTLFAEEGAQVTGVDFSKNSLDYAEKAVARLGG